MRRTARETVSSYTSLAMTAVARCECHAWYPLTPKLKPRLQVAGRQSISKLKQSPDVANAANRIAVSLSSSSFRRHRPRRDGKINKLDALLHPQTDTGDRIEVDGRIAFQNKEAGFVAFF